MSSMRPLLAGTIVLMLACVSRSAPVRLDTVDRVGATRSEGSFTSAVAPLDAVLMAREYLVGQGLTVLDTGAADRLEARHPFTEDRYVVAVSAEGSGSRIVVAGTAPGRDPALAGRVEALAQGVRAYLGGGGPGTCEPRGSEGR